MNIIENESINTKIYTIRDTKVMLDSDLAKLYQVETKRINEQVKRNIDRFPSDFIFQLTDLEFKNLRSQNATANFNMIRNTPYAFTEQGVYMLATVLKSKVATDVTINIMRTFTKLREFALDYNDIFKRLQDIERTIKIDQHQLNYNTERIDEAFELLNEILQDTKNTNKTLIGFRPNKEK